MPRYTFTGGIHPYDGKDLTKDKPIRNYKPSGQLVFPLSQHIGAPAKPVVAVGDNVLRGQMIAEAGGFVSAPIHSSVSGRVAAIEPRRVVTGDMINSIIIENDNEYNEIAYSPVDNLSSLSKEDILNRVREAGVVGMGGAGFPTHVKLSPKEPDKIDYVIVNGAECEPYLTSDYRRMLEEPDKVIDGLRCILRLFDNAKGIIAIEDNKKDCISLFKSKVLHDPDISVRSVKTKYPQGSERQLIYATTGRAINSDMLPADAGCIVDNIDTVVAIYHGVMEGKPLMERIVTVTGDAVSSPCNFRVYIGTNYHELVDAAGGFKSRPAKMISGGPMMGFGIFDLDLPTTKTASALLAFLHDDVSEQKPSACINCGRCIEVCPGRVAPKMLAECAEHYDTETFVKLGGMECCECGCCSFICPAKRPLTQSIKSMRKIELANRRKK